jgi:MtN3 and saliva related transmembrane protein
MALADWIGPLAAATSVASFAPQAWKVIRERNTEGLSVGMYALTVLAFVLWAVFGILKTEWAIIVPNTLCMLLSAFIMVMILLPHEGKAKVAKTIDPAASDD